MYLRGKAHSRTSYLTHVGCSSGNAMRPTTAVVVMRRGCSRLGRRAPSPWCCGGLFKAGLCRIGRNDPRQSQVREVYVVSKDSGYSAGSCTIPGGL